MPSAGPKFSTSSSPLSCSTASRMPVLRTYGSRTAAVKSFVTAIGIRDRVRLNGAKVVHVVALGRARRHGCRRAQKCLSAQAAERLVIERDGGDAVAFIERRGRIGDDWPGTECIADTTRVMGIRRETSAD